MKALITRGLPRLPLLFGVLAVFALATGCSQVRDAINGDESTPTPEATNEASVISAVQPSATVELATGVIGNTGGLGVSLRSDCATDARIDGAWAETTEVEILERGTGRCEGWSLAQAGGVTTWVSQAYLISDAPVAPVTALAAPAPPTSPTAATPSPTFTATPDPTGTPTAAPAASGVAPVPPATLYGPIAADDSVLILVNHQPCKTVTAITDVTSPTGHLWLAQIEQNECGAQTGSTLSFALNGADTNEQFEWSPGAVPLNIATGLTLTLR